MYTIKMFISDLSKLPISQEVIWKATELLITDKKYIYYEEDSYPRCDLYNTLDTDLGNPEWVWKKNGGLFIRSTIAYLVMEALGYHTGAIKILGDKGYCPLVKSSVSKGILEVLKVQGNPSRYDWLELGLLWGWSIDILRKIPSNCIELPLGFNRISARQRKEDLKALIEWVGLEKFIRLLEVKTKKFNHNGEEREVNTTGLLMDTLSCYSWFKHNKKEEALNENKPRLRDLFELHDYLFKLKVHLEPSFQLKQYPEIQDIIGSSWEGYDVVFPKESTQLKEWGHKLSHCVGSYGELVNKGHSCVFSLEKGEPRYTVELNPSKEGKSWKVNQFYGYKNSDAPNSLVDKMKRLFTN